MKFLTEDKCRAHHIKHENEEAERPFACIEEDCCATFKSQHHLKSHMIAIQNFPAKFVAIDFTQKHC